MYFSNITRLQGRDEILRWIETEAGQGSAVAAVDAPLVIPNATGTRAAERELNRDYRRFHAGCHAANLGRPFAANVLEFSSRLRDLGFAHGPSMNARPQGRFQIEVHPHAASVSLFGLERIVKYKRGRREDRARELNRLRTLMLAHLPVADLHLPLVPEAGNLKPVEDQIDAVLCAFIGVWWWLWGEERSRVYGSAEEGYVIVPSARAAHIK